MEGQDCQRDNCLICFTKLETEKNKTQCCVKRNLIYETRCLTCETRDKNKIIGESNTEQEARDKIRDMKIHKYIGETSRSGYERGWEHWHDLQELSSRSHMLKHAVNFHQGEDFNKIKFGMKVLAHTRTSFERQIKEAVLIQQERGKHTIMNSKSEYNRSALPRIVTQLGEQETKDWEKKMRQEKMQEDETEAKIRTLRKQRNKDRMVAPTEPPSKRRKLENSYINMKQAWGEPEKSEARKVTRQELEQEKSQLTSQESPLPPPNKKSRQEKLTNIVTLQDKVVEGPIEDLEWEEKIDWEEHLKKHREEIEKITEEREKRIKIKEDKEKSWELYNICRNFLEENSEDWEKNKKKRQEEKNRLERLELAKSKQRNSQINHVKRKIEEGMKRLPGEDRKRLEEDEKKRERLEIQKTKKELWKLRRKEKKITKNQIPESLKEIQKTTSKLEKFTYILEKVKRKEELEKERKIKQAEIEEKLRKILNEKRLKKIQKEKENKERLKKIEKIQEKWALMRWVTAFIEENSETWEKERKERIEKERKEIYEWERKNRLEKIKELKRKWEDKKRNETVVTETQQNIKNPNKPNKNIEKFVQQSQGRANTWSQWRAYKAKTRPNNITKTRKVTLQPTSKEITTQLTVKILPSKLKITRENKKYNEMDNKKTTTANNKLEQQQEITVIKEDNKTTALTRITPADNKHKKDLAVVTTQNTILDKNIQQQDSNNKQESQQGATTNNINQVLKPATGDRFSTKKQTEKRNNKQEKLKEAAKSCKNIRTFFKPVTRDTAKNYGRDMSLPSQQDDDVTRDISCNTLCEQSIPQLVPKLIVTVFTPQRSHISESEPNSKSSNNLARD